MARGMLSETKEGQAAMGGLSILIAVCLVADASPLATGVVLAGWVAGVAWWIWRRHGRHCAR